MKLTEDSRLKKRSLEMQGLAFGLNSPQTGWLVVQLWT